MREKYGKVLGGFQSQPYELDEFIFDLEKVPKGTEEKKYASENGLFYDTDDKEVKKKKNLNFQKKKFF